MLFAFIAISVIFLFLLIRIYRMHAQMEYDYNTLKGEYRVLAEKTYDITAVPKEDGQTELHFTLRPVTLNYHMACKLLACLENSIFPLNDMVNETQQELLIDYSDQIMEHVSQQLGFDAVQGFIDVETLIFQPVEEIEEDECKCDGCAVHVEECECKGKRYTDI